jgi:DNA invertase Pin-like site-specific DNA recombinase
MTLAYSYIRMSTTQQLTGDSLRRQTEKATEYAKVNGLELDQKFKLTDIGFSAYDGSNVDKGSLGLFLASIKEKRIPVGSVLIVESYPARILKKHCRCFLILLTMESPLSL